MDSFAAAPLRSEYKLGFGIAMLFIPGRNGYSHCPTSTHRLTIVRGTLVLAETLAALSQ